MQYSTIDGVVIRTSDYGANDRYLSILTAKEGRITLLSKGGRSLKGEQLAISQPFTFCNFEYYTKGNVNILKGGSVQKSFHGLGKTLEGVALGYYLCDLACELSDEGEDAEELLRLILNSFYAISAGEKYPLGLIKGAFEWRAAAISGYMPALDACERCGQVDGDAYYLHVMNGSLLCKDCLRRGLPHAHGDEDTRAEELLCPLTPSGLAALRYCLHAPAERLFSFAFSDAEELASFGRVTEAYILSHLGRGFKTLDYYHSILAMP